MEKFSNEWETYNTNLQDRHGQDRHAVTLKWLPIVLFLRLIQSQRRVTVAAKFTSFLSAVLRVTLHKYNSLLSFIAHGIVP
jgi:hypothetical protein